MKLYWGSITKYPVTPEMTEEKVYELLGKWRGDNFLKHKTELGRALSFCAGMTLKAGFEKNNLDLISYKPLFLEDGKPYIEGVQFNLSHSGKVALVAVSEDFNPVGCDVQIVENKKTEKLMAITKRFFSVTEVAKMQDVLQGQKEAFLVLFHLIFSAKEAYIKMTGEGLKRRMDSFEVPLDEKIIESILNRDEDPIERIIEIEEKKVRFTYYLPQNIQFVLGNDCDIDEYVAVTCKYY